MKKKSRKTFIIMSLLIAMGIMSIGFAVLSSRLNIVAETRSNGSFDVQIEDIDVKTVSGNAVNRGFEKDGLTATFSADLFTLNDYVEYEVEVKNKGNIPAILTSVTKENTQNVNNIISFTTTATEGTVLAAGQSTTFDVKISVDNTSVEDIINTQYELTLVFTQYDS